MAPARGCSVIPFLVVFMFSFWDSDALVSQLERSLTPVENDNKVLRAEMIHRDHPDSPLSSPIIATPSERVAAAANRSMQRAERIARRLAGAAFQTPVTAGNGDYTMTIYFVFSLYKMHYLTRSFQAKNSTSYLALPCTDPQCNANVSLLLGTSCDPYCHIQYGYGDGTTIAGDLSEDTMTLTNTSGTANPVISNFTFGCMNNDTSNTLTGADGIFGFGRGPLSLPSQLIKSYLDVFSYCLIPYIATTTLTSPLLFGYPASTLGVNVSYTYMLYYPSAPTFYYVNLTGISVDGVDLGVPSEDFQVNSTTGKGGVIFDSGTTLTFLPSNALSLVKKAVSSLVNLPRVNNTSDLLCFNVSGMQSVEVPTMDLHLSSVDGSIVKFDLAAYNLWIDVGNGTLCLAIIPSSEISIIGNIAQANHYIEYNLVNQTLAWVTADCEFFI